MTGGRVTNKLFFFWNDEAEAMWNYTVKIKQYYPGEIWNRCFKVTSQNLT